MRTGSFICFHQPSFGPWPAYAASSGVSWLSALAKEQARAVNDLRRAKSASG